MKVVIIGCGRVGSLTAQKLSDAGHEVVVVDWQERAFHRLPPSFRGRAVRGNAIEQDTLRQAEVQSADVFLAATGGDNRNIMTSQVAKRLFDVPKVIARIKDPERAQIYSDLDIEVECRTIAGASAILDRLGIDS
jgi:trk system potassium uptake protein TrkA